MYQELAEANSQQTTFSRRTKGMVLGLMLIGAVAVGSVVTRQAKPLRGETSVRLENYGSPKKMAVDGADEAMKELVKTPMNVEEATLSGDDIQSNPDATSIISVSNTGWTFPITANGQPVSFDLSLGGKRLHKICVFYYKYIRGFNVTFIGSPTYLVAGETSGLYRYCGRVSGTLCWGDVIVRVSPMAIPGHGGPDSQGISSMEFSYRNTHSPTTPQTRYFNAGLDSNGHVTTVRSNNYCLAGIKGKLRAGTLTEVELNYQN